MPSGYDPRAVLEMQYSKHTPNSSRMASGYHQFTFISWDKLGYGSPTTMVVSIYLVHLERWYFFCEYQEHYPILPTDATILYTSIYTHTHLRYTKHQPTRLCFFKMYPKCPGAHPRCFEPLYNFMVVVSILRVHTLK